MKQIKLFSMMLLLATIFVGFNACSSDDDNNNQSSYEELIIGKWLLIVSDGSNEVEHLVFKSNGIMTWGSDDYISDYARYKIINNKIYFRWSDKDNLENESQEWWNDTNYNNEDNWESSPIYELNSTTLKIRWSDIETYKRVN